MLLRKNWLSFAALLLVFLSGPALLGAPQQGLLNRSFPEVGKYNFTWDSVNKVLIFVRNAAPTATTATTIVAYHDGGAPTRISPLNDLPGATYVYFWGISGAPNGAVCGSSTVEYGTDNRTDNPRQLILTYDQKGKLIKVWDVFPYHFYEVAVDAHGNVYGFGHRLDKADEASDGDYAMLVAYSPEGKILWEALPRSSFPWGGSRPDVRLPKRESLNADPWRPPSLRGIQRRVVSIRFRREVVGTLSPQRYAR